ncbi:hypothetical protein E5C31_13100 [Providencia rettgeri]|nr:hypothetical protein [Providencia rettgeri]
MESKERKHLIQILVFVAIMVAGWYMARQETRIESERVRTECVRESYKMAEQYGDSPRLWERDCIRQYEQDSLERRQ